MQPDLEKMSVADLRTYVLSHRHDLDGNTGTIVLLISGYFKRGIAVKTATTNLDIWLS